MEDVETNIDLASAIALWGVLASALVAFAVAKVAWGLRGHERLARERGLPLLGKVPMEAVYAVIFPIGRALGRLGLSANAVSVASLAIAAGAGVLFGAGHFGAGAAVAAIATLADALDGIVARETRTATRFGQVLDTTIDRYVDALLLGGVALFVHEDAWLLALTIAALVGSFMVSYASSVLRELGAEDSAAPMRRAHRVAYLIGAAALVPITELALADAPLAFRLLPMVAALAAIALVGNVSAVARLLRAARQAEREARLTEQDTAPASAPESRSMGHAGAPIDSVVTRERHP
ncbi:MAG: CDP-alcohol phosphatidyltransferase family protein [Labilithrix sp.]|nr:CDP-alcohol phosphatidyltransferase family protein [Labilithrix sp.]MCW5832682.1 CDP-alcohol phosphatidyltransferase family protein [Labilithrix sp.]